MKLSKYVILVATIYLLICAVFYYRAANVDEVEDWLTSSDSS